MLHSKFEAILNCTLRCCLKNQKQKKDTSLRAVDFLRYTMFSKKQIWTKNEKVLKELIGSLSIYKIGRGLSQGD